MLVKPSTADKKHYHAAYIKTVGVPAGYEDKGAVMGASLAVTPNNYADVPLVLTRNAYNRIKRGGGSRHKLLRKGLRANPRFSFIVCTEGTGDNERVTNIHAYPTIDYAQADMEEELKMNLNPEDAVVQIHPDTGDIDILAFPFVFYTSHLQAFIKWLENETRIDYDKHVRINNVLFTVTDIRGSMITFDCVRQR